MTEKNYLNATVVSHQERIKRHKLSSHSNCRDRHKNNQIAQKIEKTTKRSEGKSSFPKKIDKLPYRRNTVRNNSISYKMVLVHGLY